MTPSREYIAGFFDGEGTVHITKASRKWRPDSKTKVGTGWHLVVSLANTYLPVLQEIGAIYRAKSIPYHVKKGVARKPCYKLRFKSAQAQRFLKDIAPYLVVKKSQAELGIQFHDYVHSRKGGSRLSLEEIAERDRFRVAIQVLNMKTGKRGTATKSMEVPA